MENLGVEVKQKSNKLWNKNFFLLWQGQLVSCLGDALYSIALGFWVLEKTGSSAIMGTLMASISIPRIIIGPFAGVLVDRFNRKKIIILGDLIRGLGMLFVAFGSYKGFLEVWMVMIIGIVSGICSSFFNPSIMSVMPDIVPSDKLVKANSAYQLATTSTSLVGNMSGGFLFSILGAPILFFINGVSYILSSATEVFINIPKVERKNSEFKFKEDLTDGFKFIYKLKGIIWLIVFACFLNFLFGIFTILLMPWFSQDDSLGVVKYGIMNATMSMGMLSGMALLSVVNIKCKDKFKTLNLGLTICVTGIFIGTYTDNFYGICGFYFVSLASMAISNTMLNTSLQIIVPQDMRGKVNSIVFTASSAIQPIGVLLGGILGEFFYPRNVILVCFIISMVLVIPIYFLKSTKKVLNFDPETQTLDDIL